MTPPQLHISFELLFRAGIFPIRTVGDPGVHGAAILGIQGWGLMTPGGGTGVIAATWGLAGERHTPKGVILTIGLLSIILAYGILVKVLLAGNTLSVPGVAPIEHIKDAPPHTKTPIFSSYALNSMNI